jgi:hypothetical protein
VAAAAAAPDVQLLAVMVKLEHLPEEVVVVADIIASPVIVILDKAAGLAV